MWKYILGHVGINRKSKVLYPSPGFPSSATGPSKPISTMMDLSINRLITWRGACFAGAGRVPGTLPVPPHVLALELDQVGAARVGKRSGLVVLQPLAVRRHVVAVTVPHRRFPVAWQVVVVRVRTLRTFHQISVRINWSKGL